ncbi:zinc-ribbon domain-containing protein [Staphylococcus pettenkoferi]|uniref:zinc ribbon domain-containing protein n=1 Tax=Staphylococcus pettenkoferi TaxID=170573 RepID=UPI002277006F|nr:zinc-ribbon domain-containing protein [Staphylococcus pettenkoferi]MCY1589537.1 zinc-ribbon domain-containing protein [Staphylococcus pettenkoferi]MCY1612817.1 zinc-ribbon domain-containing protein [Staphylococcus pettenkoferi]
MKFCPECGNKLSESNKFCPECGFKIPEFPVESKENNESYEVIETQEKIHSEDYIINTLKSSHLSDIYISPKIPEKLLVNAAVSIAENIDPHVIIALKDMSTLSNGKAGIVFTGSMIYIKNYFESVKKIPLKNIDTIQYDSDTNLTDDGKVVAYEILEINYNDGNTVTLHSEKLGKDFPFRFFESLLKDFNKKVDKISTRNQVVQLSNMKNDIILLYFRIVIAYLKDDDGVIDSREYKELVSLMTKVKVSKEIASELRNYRFEDIEDRTIIELIDELKNHLNEEDISETVVQQSLAMDIIGMHSDELDKIKDNEVLTRMLNRLNMTDKQINYIVRKIKAEKDILKKRLTDSQIKDVARELTAIAGGGRCLTRCSSYNWCSE